MGQAKQRGTFEERRAQAVKRLAAPATTPRLAAIADHKPVYIPRRRPMGAAILLAAMASSLNQR
jgi:hypothetical protein